MRFPLQLFLLLLGIITAGIATDPNSNAPRSPDQPLEYRDANPDEPPDFNDDNDDSPDDNDDNPDESPDFKDSKKESDDRNPTWYSGYKRQCAPGFGPCPRDMTCKPDPFHCYKNMCARYCVYKNFYPNCHKHRYRRCRPGARCVSDPRNHRDCGLKCNKPGICIPKKPPTCGGFAGKKCPRGLYCYDNPDDNCNPWKGGADCPGICL